MLKFNWVEFRNKWIWKPDEKPGVEGLTSVEELFKSLDNDRAWFQDICVSIKYKIRYLWEWPGDFIREIKFGVQRWKRGYSDRDVWGFDYYLTEVIIGGLEQLRKNKQGFPISVIDNTMPLDKDGNLVEDGDTLASKKWDMILDSMIATFKLTKEIQDRNLLIPHKGGEYYTEDELKKEQELCAKFNTGWYAKKYPEDKYKTITREEFEKYKLGWKYFMEYYYNLWD